MGGVVVPNVPELVVGVAVTLALAAAGFEAGLVDPSKQAHVSQRLLGMEVGE